MQVTNLSRYGIRNFAVAGKDYAFANQDPYDLRYENVININPFHGVRQTKKNGIISYDTYIHIRGDYRIGSYATLHEAAIWRASMESPKIFRLILLLSCLQGNMRSLMWRCRFRKNIENT